MERPTPTPTPKEDPPAVAPTAVAPPDAGDPSPTVGPKDSKEAPPFSKAASLAVAAKDAEEPPLSGFAGSTPPAEATSDEVGADASIGGAGVKAADSSLGEKGDGDRSKKRKAATERTSEPALLTPAGYFPKACPKAKTAMDHAKRLVAAVKVKNNLKLDWAIFREMIWFFVCDMKMKSYGIDIDIDR